MTRFWQKFCAFAPASAVAVLLLFLASCSSSPKIRGIPDKLPHIALSSSSATPPHRLASSDYPFDARGNYVSDWAADGERRSGRAATASLSDATSWEGSHGGSRKVSTPKKVASTSSKPKSSSTTRKVASSSSSKPNVKKSSSSSSRVAANKPKPKSSSSGGGSKYSVKKGDTLSAIARRNGTTVAKLKSANGLSSDNIGIGKSLKIPK